MSGTAATSTFEDWWEQMLMESVMLRDHAFFYTAQSTQPTMRHPFIDQFGPRVMYVKMIALMDEALVQYLEAEMSSIGYDDDEMNWRTRLHP